MNSKGVKRGMHLNLEHARSFPFSRAASVGDMRKSTGENRALEYGGTGVVNTVLHWLIS